MYSIITIGGSAGTGKTTVGKLLAERIDYRFISFGEGARRIIQEKYKITVDEFQRICKEDEDLDKKLDSTFVDGIRNEEKVVLDYRLGFLFFSEGYNILLRVSDEIAEKRISLRKNIDENIDIESIIKRNEEARLRFKRIYGVDISNSTNYNLTIDTDFVKAEQILEIILEQMKKIGDDA